MPVSLTSTASPISAPSVGTPTPLPTPASSATATPQFLGDCGWRGEFYTWVDANANGAIDSGEPPLPGVAIRRENVVTGAAGTLGVTDAAGIFYHETLLGGCPVVQFAVSAQASPGYRPTTPERVPEDIASRQLGAQYRFGFAPITSTPTR